MGIVLNVSPSKEAHQKVTISGTEIVLKGDLTGGIGTGSDRDPLEEIGSGTDRYPVWGQGIGTVRDPKISDRSTTLGNGSKHNFCC